MADKSNIALADDRGNWDLWIAAAWFVTAFPLEWALILYRGWCLSILWAWFVVPLGLPTLRFYQAVGILFIAGLLRNGRLDETIGRDSKMSTPVFIFLSFLRPSMALVLSYAVKTWLGSFGGF